MSRVVMKMLSPIKCLRVFLKEGTSSVLGLGGASEYRRRPQPPSPKRVTRLDSCYGGWPAGFAGRCINKLVSVLD